MKKAKHLSYIAFLSLMLASCSVDGSGESLSLSEESEPASFLSSQSSDDVSVPADSTTSLSRSSRERNPFSIPGDSTYYTVSFYQSYYIKRGDDGEPIYGNPRFDFSMTIKHGETLYSTADDYHALLSECHPIIPSVGGTYSIIGFYSDKGCKHDIPYGFKVTSGMNAYYYCD